MEQATCGTDRGQMREKNEDSLLCLPEKHIFMVADGVGGHKAGDLASALAKKYLEEQIRSFPPSKNAGEEELITYFLKLLQDINDKISQIAKESKEQYGMATTSVMLYLDENKAYVINVGDSRVYLEREGKLQQITEDHTFVNELLKKGTITKEEAEHHPRKNMITRALGSEGRLQPDFYRFDVFPGDRLLLCTDGLYNELDEDSICSILAESLNTDKMVEELIRRANENGGSDNITVVCVKI